MHKLKLILKGRVQKVMLRDFLRRKALATEFKGWVINLPKNTVYMEAYHKSAETLKNFAENIDFPFWVKIKNLDYKIDSLEEYDLVPESFMIKF